MRSFLMICCLVVCVCGVSTTNISETTNVLEKWESLEKDIKGLAGEGVKFILPTLLNAMYTLNISSICARDTMKVIAGAWKTEYWALRFLDASGKMLDGILSGSLSAFGAYDECIETQAINKRNGKNKGQVLFTGKYCFVEIKPPLPPKNDYYKLNEVLDEFKNFSKRDTVIRFMAKYAQFFHMLSFRMGLCVPSTCSKEDINQIVVKAASYTILSAVVPRCEVKVETVFTPLMIAVISIFSFAGFLMLIGTLIDLHSHFTKRSVTKFGLKLLTSFSFISNFRKFVDTSTSSDTLSCLNGIRFIGMSWIILGHTYLIINFYIFSGLEAIRAYSEDFAFQAIVNATVAVDTFFFIGGLLVCYLITKNCILSKKPFNVKIYILHRIWRIIPAYFFVIAFGSLTSLLGHGPVWFESTHAYIQDCYDNWWSNLIFINNFYHVKNMCIPHSWYIACDMQLYIAALIIILPLLRWRKVGLSIAVASIFACIVTSALLTYLNNYPPAMLFAHPDPEQRLNYTADFYFKPYIHAGPYCIGLLSGYLLATKPKLRISMGIQVLGWCLSIIFCMSVLYGVLGWNSGVDPTFWETILYSGFSRSAWTLGVAWMVICCATGHGGIINYILSWKVWIPLGRLTFLAYLIHPIVQYVFIGNMKGKIDPAHYFAVWVYCGYLMITYAAAFAGSMLIEAPFLSLEKIAFPRGEKDDHSSQRKSSIDGINKACSNLDLNSPTIIHSKIGKGEGLDNNGFICKL